ncbi:MAG: type II toxin-antitoxin system prevent-host-death family antitoxin [Desulfobacteraceae bacterium]|nr:type II toxin-antitoxin system prevent-host-death family antitoxin [Desulfobacteraceae bacterium]MBU4056000.1 type II toxin-antitoxin system prevent-host-death family antitoxin [Pseudomonadota bacterium]
MQTVNIKEVRTNLSSLLNRVETGEEIIITRRGNVIAKLVPTKQGGDLPSLKKFRSSIRSSEKSLSRSIVDSREKERY